jgi:lysozyme family protein
MQDNFKPSLAAVLKSEGGYSNNIHDPGHATNKGITQATYNEWLAKLGRPKRSVALITDAEVEAIYKANYWDAEECDKLPYGLDYAVFDWAVNSGTVRADTAIDKVKELNPSASVESLINLYMAERLTFLQKLSNWKYFGKGWANRVASVKALALKMAKNNATKATTELVKDKPKIEVPTMNGSKTYILSAILAAIATTLTAVGSLDPKTGVGAVLVSAILFALRHGMSTSVAYIIQTLSGILQQALISSAPDEAKIAGFVKAAVAEALAEQAASNAKPVEVQVVK